MLTVARAVARSFRARSMRVETNAKFGRTSSSSPRSRSSSYAIVAADKDHTPPLEDLGQERIALGPPTLVFRLVEHRVIDLPAQLPLEVGDGLVHLAQVRPAPDQQVDVPRAF